MPTKRVGIDIGSSAVHGVEVTVGKNGPQIVRAGSVPLERGVVVGGDVRDPGLLSDTLLQLREQTRFSTSNAVFGLGGAQTLVRQLDLPWEEPETFRSSLPFRVGNELPIGQSEMTLDYHPLEIFERGTALMQRCLVVAAANVAVENAVDALTMARFKPRRADFAPFALIRAACAGSGIPVPPAPRPGEERPCEVVVDIGAQLVTIAIHDQGRPLFLRTVPGGSDAITRALMDQLRVSLETAEALKRSLGIAAVGGAVDNTDPYLSGITPAHFAAATQITTMMGGALVQIARESVDYFLTASTHTSEVSRVLMSGGGSRIPGIAQRMSGDLGAPAAVMNVAERFGNGRLDTDLDPTLAVAFGLALDGGR